MDPPAREVAVSRQEALELIDKLDLNGDGKLSKSEKAVVEARFEALEATTDVNGDGRVSRHEALDLNGDGRVTKSEKDELDANGDGAISRLEAVSLRGAIRDAHADEAGLLEILHRHGVEAVASGELSEELLQWKHALPPASDGARHLPLLGLWATQGNATNELALAFVSLAVLLSVAGYVWRCLLGRRYRQMHASASPSNDNLVQPSVMRMDSDELQVRHTKATPATKAAWTPPWQELPPRAMPVRQLKPAA